jgi:rubredoxin
MMYTSYESQQVLLQGSNQGQTSVNATSRGCSGFHRGRGGWLEGVTTSTSSRTTTINKSVNGKCPICQSVKKEGHTTIQCWYRFDESVGAEKKTVAAITHTYGVDTNWYTNTGTTYHITGEVEKPDVRNN